ncbi:MAG TPA: biotin--[acetyl-CoA-carboxylase] ligase, partial [Solirubrobacteraceae bacterium]|nr:biotin--[acetyl-CoA-carboxylase] ligase [Solirubrobacteraceae bacterium]
MDRFEGRLGSPRAHFRLTDSTNARARSMASAGAPHGTVVTAAEQSAGRGRQGRTWSAPAGRALLCSIVVREPPRLLPLVAGVAVADVVESAVARVAVADVVESAVAGVAVGDVVESAVAGVVESPVASPAASSGSGSRPDVAIKWPNDVLAGGLKVAGILVEARLQDGWAVAGIGLNVAVAPEDFPPDLRDRAGTLGLEPSAIEPTLGALLRALERWLGADVDSMLDAVRARDALLGREVRWGGQKGVGAGIDGDGRLVVRTDAGEVRLDAGEVHLGG